MIHQPNDSYRFRMTTMPYLNGDRSHYFYLPALNLGIESGPAPDLPVLAVKGIGSLTQIATLAGALHFLSGQQDGSKGLSCLSAKESSNLRSTLLICQSPTLQTGCPYHGFPAPSRPQEQRRDVQALLHCVAQQSVQLTAADQGEARSAKTHCSS